MSRKPARHTKATDAFIKSSYGQKSVREMADELGFSRSTVQRRITFLKLNENPSLNINEKLRDAKEEISNRDSDTLTRLIELRDILRTALDEAGANSKPRIASEYRAVLKDIYEMEAKENASGKESAFDVLFAELGGKSDS